MLRYTLLASFCLVGLLLGCASTKVDTAGTTPKASLCQSATESLSALVLWGPIWRPNQKDLFQREEAAQQGLAHYFANSRCFARVAIRRLPGGTSTLVPSTPELLSLASAESPRPDRVLVITVRELGPVIKLMSSAALVEGGTEVVLELTAVDVQTGSLLASSRTHWQNGGALVLKGVKTLPQDMSAALSAALTPQSSSQ